MSNVIKDYVDFMINQEKVIQKTFRNHITDTPNEIELYYYKYYLIISLYQKFGTINQNIQIEYSNKSMDKLVSSTKTNIDRDDVLNKRNERFINYEIMWKQVDYDKDERTSRMAAFFNFASESIYGTNIHGMTLTFMFAEINERLFAGIESYLD